MNYNFSERKKQNKKWKEENQEEKNNKLEIKERLEVEKKVEEKEKVEEKIQFLKKEYQKLQMSDKQVEKLKEKIKEANQMNQKEQEKRKKVRVIGTAAAVIGAILILPNTSAGIAHAMEQIPILGQLVKVVTFRDYEYETERHMADIKVPEIKLEESIENSEIQEKLERTKDEINAEIQKITNELIEEFETYLGEKEGYQDIIVKSETLATTKDYFTLKLICYQGAGRL